MENLRFTAPIELQAAEPPNRPAKCHILAYSGAMMAVAGFGDVVISLAGLELPGVIPLLADHDSSLSGVCGSGVPRVQAGCLHVSGTLAGSPAGHAIRELHASGVPLQASVGVHPTDCVKMRSGDKVQCNGREIVAGQRGLTLVKAGKLQEVSILPLGADTSTSVTIAAKRGNSTMPTDVDTVDPIQAERVRCKEIRDVCHGEHPRIEAQAVDEGWDVQQVKAACLDAIRSKRGTGGAITGGMRATGGNPRDILAASAMMMAGHADAIVKTFRDGERLANGIDRPSGWPELCAFALRLENHDVPTDRNALIQAAFSTTSMPDALGLGVQKIALQVFVDMSRNWQACSRVVPAINFRPGKALRLSAVSKFLNIGRDGELKHGDLGEDAFDFQISTYGRLFGLTRADIIDDDAGILDALPIVLGSEGARTVSDLFFAMLNGNAGSFFGAGNGNLITSSPLNVASLSAAIATLRNRTDRDGRVLNLQPTCLLVPAALESTGKAILHSEFQQRIVTSDGLPTGNPFSDLNLCLCVEPRLDLSSTTSWYLCGDVRFAPFLVAFLNGATSPIVEIAPTPPGFLGWMWRGYLDTGVSFGEHRAVVKATA
jgi:hypothetical protein